MKIEELPKATQMYNLYGRIYRYLAGHEEDTHTGLPTHMWCYDQGRFITEAQAKEYVEMKKILSICGPVVRKLFHMKHFLCMIFINMLSTVCG
jgi:hypothetical protein